MALSILRTIAHTDPDLATTTLEVLAANVDRRWALIINDSAVVVYLKVGVAAVVNEGIRLNASGGSFEMSEELGNLDTRAINGLAASGSGNTTLVSEGVDA